MIGRGLLAMPDLPLCIKAAAAFSDAKRLSWLDIHQHLLAFFQDCMINCPPKHVGGPVKQWLGYLRGTYPEAEQLFSKIKRLKTASEIELAIIQSLAVESLETAA